MELAIGIILLCVLLLLWLTWLTSQWHKERTKNKILKAENRLYKDFIIQNIHGKESGGEKEKAEEP